MRQGEWIQVHTGGQMYPLDAKKEEIHIEDIGHALSNLCRFTGHTKQFYSVAEHCAHVHDILPEQYRLEGLLHDASEAYICDVARPLKASGDFGRLYLLAEQDLMQVIACRFDFDFPLPYEVHNADNILLKTEALQLMSPLHPEWQHSTVTTYAKRLPCWKPERAKKEFLTRFYACCRQGEEETKARL